MTFDTKVPHKLKKIQSWFGSIIGRPIDEDSRMNPISPTGQPMEIEACDYIVPSPTLRPSERIQIYNQQYWWRLLNALQESFPLVTRLFGYHDFNRTIAIPYLVKYPPNHWSLNLLGSRLLQWAEEEYLNSDRQLILDAIRVDWAFGDSFCAPERPPITMETLPVKGDPSSLLECRVTLQPHIHLFHLCYDLFDFRTQFLKQEPEYWIEHDFPPLNKEKSFYFVLFRNAKGDISRKEISKAEYELLNRFSKGTTIVEACDWLETQEKAMNEEAQENMHLWFQQWIVHRWLIPTSSQNGKF